MKKTILILAAASALVAMACDTGPSGSDLYYACALPSAGDAAERCGDGDTCRSVNGRAVCVPEDQADNFDEVEPGDDAGDTGGRDTGEQSDTSTHDAQDTGRDADTSDDAGENDTTTECNLDEIVVNTGEFDVPPIEPGAQLVRAAPHRIELTISNLPAALNNAEASYSVGFEPSVEYPEYVATVAKNSQTSEFGVESDSGNYRLVYNARRLGTHIVNLELTSEQGCEWLFDFTVEVVAFPADSDRCLYAEIWPDTESEFVDARAEPPTQAWRFDSPASTFRYMESTTPPSSGEESFFHALKLDAPPVDTAQQAYVNVVAVAPPSESTSEIGAVAEYVVLPDGSHDEVIVVSYSTEVENRCQVSAVDVDSR